MWYNDIISLVDFPPVDEWTEIEETKMSYSKIANL